MLFDNKFIMFLKAFYAHKHVNVYAFHQYICLKFSLMLRLDVACDSFSVDSQTIFSRESFVKTRAQVQDVIEGWRSKVEG